MSKRNLKLIGLVLAIGISFGVYFFQNQPTGQVLGQYLNASSTELRLIFFDVGQGDSSLIITPSGEKILVDGGPDRSVVNKIDSVLPITDRQLDYVILTHPHSDHVAGLPEILHRYRVGQVIMTGAVHTAPDYLDFLKLIKEKNIPVKIIDSKQELIVGEVALNFLAPTKSYLETRPANLNISSIVFRLVYASTSVLYTGDFEDEESLVASSSNLLKSDLIKIGHHGSNNANDRKFLEAVDPRYAVISVGKDNSFGHPHYRTIFNLNQLRTAIFRTDEEGTIFFSSNGRTIKLLTN